jgi:hypothetical protein
LNSVGEITHNKGRTNVQTLVIKVPFFSLTKEV